MKRETAKKAALIGKKCIVRATYINKPTWDIQKIGERPAWITGFGVIRRGTTSHDWLMDLVLYTQLLTKGEQLHGK